MASTTIKMEDTTDTVLGKRSTPMLEEKKVKEEKTGKQQKLNRDDDDKIIAEVLAYPYEYDTGPESEGEDDDVDVSPSWDGDMVLNPDGTSSYEPINMTSYPGACACLMRECLCHQEAWFVKQCMMCELEIKSEFKAVRMPRIKGGWTDCFCSWDCVRKAIKLTGGNTMGREGMLQNVIQGEQEFLAEHHETDDDEDEDDDESEEEDDLSEDEE
jgi:hypothetical protein